jgi:predicted ATP-dependent endonuclease of OLD family
MLHLSVDRKATASVTPIRACGLSSESKPFLARWLDVTKSTLLFAKSVILVEGIAEALLLPELSSRVLRDYNAKASKQKQLPESLDDCGVAVVNMNGIYFKHFMQLFCNLEGGEHCSLPVLCAGLTDQDPPKTEKAADGSEILIKPTPADKREGTNKALELIPTINASAYARLFAGELKTFEYDLGMTGGNLDIMLEVAAELRKDQPKVSARFANWQVTDWASEEDEDRRASASCYLLQHIDKGEFAQALACKIARPGVTFGVPDYIRKAVLWACGGVDV